MKHPMITTICLLSVLFSGSILTAEPKRDHRLHQYHFGDVSIPPASADETIAERLSLTKAGAYLEDGAKAWVNDRGCVSCHTTGWYGILRPQLSSLLGPPDPSFRSFLERILQETLAEERNKTERGTGPAEVVYLAAALAAWDAHITKQLSSETAKALELMFSLQRGNGAWYSVETWPPFESDAYQLATVAAMAVGLAPKWLNQHQTDDLGSGFLRLTRYLKSVPPPHEYARVALLWASQYQPDVLDAAGKEAIAKMILDRQRPDGGWSIRSFAEPEQWGVGNRSERLRGEADFGEPASDGHQTGLSIIVLSQAGLPSSHPALKRGIAWLERNQRQSGRWWTKSLNTDKWSFITYTGTLYPVLALTLMDSVPGDSPAAQ